MKKRRLKAFFLIIPIIMILMACGCPSGQSNKKNELTPEEIAEKYKNVPLDPYGCVIEDEDWVSEYKGIYLVRDDVFYGLNSVASIKERPEYNVGNVTASHTQIMIQDFKGSKGDERGLFVYTFGDYVPLVLNKDTDEIISYGISTLDLTKLENLNHSLHPNVIGDAFLGTYYNIKTTEGMAEVPSDCKEFQYTLNGEVLENTYNLEKDTEVTVSWYEGTTYNEYTCVANLGCYFATFKDAYHILGDDSSGPITIEGELHKEGYATYDLSNIEPGTYLVDSPERPNVKFNEHCLTGGGILVIE